MRILLFGFLLVFPSIVFCQEKAIVRGMVREAESGEAMIAVSISADRLKGTISDAQGAFRLELEPGRHHLEFHYMGFEKASRILSLSEGEILELNVALSPSPNMLDEVVVSAGKFEQKISEVTVSMEVLKPHQISNQNITSLDMILEKTSGISILNGQPSIRGGSGFSYGVGSRVLMLVDDMPMISGDAGDIKWSFMPVENVNQVEVIKGASSVLYGSSALNGVINLRTRFPGNEPRTEVNLFSGLYMEPRRKELVWKERAPFFGGASFSHLRKIGNLDLSLGANLYKDEGYRELEHEQRARGSLALRYRFEKVKGLSLGVASSYMFTEHADFILWTDADSGAYRQNPDSYARLGGFRFNVDPYLEYYTPAGDRHSLKTRLYSVGNNTVDETKNSFSKVWYGEYRYLKKFSEQIRWTNGFALSRNTVVAGLYNEHKGSNAAVYSQLDAGFLKRFKLAAGIRWEINSMNQDLVLAAPVARAGLTWELGQSTFLRASFGQGYRFPSVAERFVDAHLSSIRIFPNPELEAEFGWSAEMGLRQGYRAGPLQGFVDLALFWTRYRDMIEYTFGYYPPENPTRPPFEYVGFKTMNVESARIAGTEFTLNGKLELGRSVLTLQAGYTFMDPVDPMLLDSTGRTEDEAWVLNYRRRHLLKGDMEASFLSLLAGINVQYNSRMINVDEVFTDPLLGEILLPGFPGYWDEEAGDYVLVDLRLGWNISRTFRVNVIARNILNEEYLGRPGDIGAPRNLTLQLRLTFPP